MGGGTVNSEGAKSHQWFLGCITDRSVMWVTPGADNAAREELRRGAEGGAGGDLTGCVVAGDDAEQLDQVDGAFDEVGVGVEILGTAAVGGVGAGRVEHD